MNIFIYILIGLSAGILSGSFGVGGGIILVPAFVFFLGMTQHQAQGTSLAVLLPPVFILAVWRYYQQGNVNIPVAIWVAVAFVFGALAGASFVQGVSDENLRRFFGLLLVLVGLKMVFVK